MSEIEIHHAHNHDNSDPLGRVVGIMVGIIGIFLAFITIESHRAHTEAIVRKTEANDQWSFFQAKKIRSQVMEVGATIIETLGTNSNNSQSAVEKLKNDSDRYSKDTEEIQKEAKLREGESATAERQALRFDLGEGFLELGLVLSSLYFLSHRKSFPIMGGISAIIGILIGLSAFFI